MIYNTGFNKSPFKYCINIISGWGLTRNDYFAYLGGQPCLFNTWTLPMGGGGLDKKLANGFSEEFFSLQQRHEGLNC